LKRQVGELMKFYELYTTKNKKALRILHGKKRRNSVSSAQQKKEKLHELCTTRKNNKKTL
jgi:hypothetical protein